MKQMLRAQMTLQSTPSVTPSQLQEHLRNDLREYGVPLANALKGRRDLWSMDEGELREANGKSQAIAEAERK